MVRVGIIGAGRIGKVHIQSICTGVRNAVIKTVADPMMTEETAAWIKSMGDIKVTKDYKEILRDEEIDAVIICSSTDTHSGISVEAIEAGKHVFCEKPIDHDIEKIKKVMEALKGSKVKYQVGFNRRFDHNFRAVREAVAAGKIGDPHIIKVTSRDPEPPSPAYVKVSGGMFLDMTIHDFDMVRYLAGSEVTEVTAYGAALSGAGYDQYDDVDTAIIMMKFENGALGVIDNSRAAHYGYDQRTEVHCDKGCVQVSNDFDNTAMISSGEGVELAKPTWFFLERYNNAFIAEAKAFTEAVLNDTETPVNGFDGIQPVKIAMAAALSLKEGRPVKIAEVE